MPTKDEFREKGKKIADDCVVYYSSYDKCWIAHGIETDQIGTGDDVCTALVKLMVAIESLVTLTRTIKDLRLYRKAPKKIIKRAERADKLPQEIYERARKRFYALLKYGAKADNKLPQIVSEFNLKHNKHYPLKISFELAL